MKYCFNCGFCLEDDALFCNSCGAKQEDDKLLHSNKTNLTHENFDNKQIPKFFIKGFIIGLGICLLICMVAVIIVLINI